MAKEKFYEKISRKLNDKKYFIIMFFILIFLPLLQGAVEIAGKYPNIFILSDLYSVLVQTGLFGNPTSTSSQNNYLILSFFTLALIFGIFAASWDLLSGYTGQFNFGHALFFGFSAYFFYLFTSANQILKSNIELNPLTKAIVSLINQFSLLPPLEAFFVSALVSALLALFIGFIALRLKGAYFALVSLILPLIVYYAILNPNLNLFPGGEFGVSNIPQIITPVNPNNPLAAQINALNLYYFTLLIFFISIGIMMLFAYSRLGDTFKAIREDEEAAESIGINITRYKILAFVVSAYFAGIAGNLFAQWQTTVYPTMFYTTNSFTPIIYSVIGGIGTVYGGALGAIILTLLMQIFVVEVFNIPGSDYLIYGLGLVFVLLFMKNGIVRAKSEQKRAMVLGVLFALSWILISHANYSNLNLLDTIVITIIALLTLPLIPFFIIAEQIGIFVLNNFLNLNLTNHPTRAIRALFLIDIVVGIPLAYYYPKIFKKIRLRIFGIWPSIGLYEPE